MEQEVAEALREVRAFPRTSRLIRLFEELTTENVAGAARAVGARTGAYDPVDLQLFLTAWAHLDPLAALREIQSWPIQARRNVGLRTVIREWAASGLTLEAGSFYDTLTDAEERAGKKRDRSGSKHGIPHGCPFRKMVIEIRKSTNRRRQAASCIGGLIN